MEKQACAKPKNQLKLSKRILLLFNYLIKNPLIGIAFFVITSAIIISILGANIRPDSSSDANTQIPQISRLEPGTKIPFLKVRKNKEIIEKNFFEKLFFGGQESHFSLVPYSDYKFVDDKILLSEYLVDSTNLNDEISQASFTLSNVIFNLNNPENQQVNNEFLQKEIEKHHLTEKTFYLGTDKHGRDMLSRLMAGTIISLSIGLVSVIISFIVGLSLGAIAGYYGGRIDDVILWFINVVWSIPGLLLIISLTLILGKGFTTVFIAVGLTMWVELARVVRGQVIALREMDYVIAGKVLGFSNIRIIFNHIIPNLLDPVIVICAANFATAILIEAGLSFLGIGVQIPTPSWGAIIDQHKEYIIHAEKSFLAIIPGVLIILLVFSFMILGHHLRNVFSKKASATVWKEKLKGAPVDSV